MYARLWWKEARQLWPISVFLVLAAAVSQVLLLNFAGREVQEGALAFLALGWTYLYTVAVGAGAFAGEREASTLRLLDILPADRRTVWAGKVSFAFATTLGLALLLLTMAAAGSEGWAGPKAESSLWALLELGTAVLAALGWGLLCSALSNNAVRAAVAAVCLGGITNWPAVAGRLVLLTEGRGTAFEMPYELILGQLVIALLTLLASFLAFTRQSGARRSRLRWGIQSPIVLTWAGPSRPRWVDRPFPSPVGLAKAKESLPLFELEMEGNQAVEAPALDEPRPRSWIAEARAMTWQTLGEGRSTRWILLVPIVLAPLLLIAGHVGFLWFNLVTTVVALTAGVSVFNLENRARTHRFLAYHGARPGLVWLVKLAVWSIGLAIVWGVLTAAVTFYHVPGRPQTLKEWIPLVLPLPLGFAAGQLCGMAIQRGITAWVVAMIATLALAVPGAALVEWLMLPVMGVLAVAPVAMLAVSWAWSDDWLFDRPAPGRWLRLGSILAGMLLVLLGGYAGSRAWGVPDASPMRAPLAWIVAAPTPRTADQNAASLYRKAGGQLFGRAATTPESLDQYRDAIELIRRAAAQPECWFTDPERITISSALDVPLMDALAGWVTVAARDRLQHRDLAGAWNDIVVLIRMAHHLGEGAVIRPAVKALAIEEHALDLAMEWASAPGQTPERLRAALATYRDLPRVTLPSEVVRAEAQLVDRSLEHFDDALIKMLNESSDVSTVGHAVQSKIWSTVVALPWERVRARRTARRLFNAAERDAVLEPWRGPRNTTANGDWNDPELDYELKSTPLLNVLLPSIGAYLDTDTRNVVARRALVQVLAIRAWQLRHDGRFPDRLDELVPEELPSLPVDPYSGKPFVYVPESPTAQTRFSSSGHNLNYTIRPAQSVPDRG
jgi:hypothetical protein